jgi:hypothetical protein
VRNQHYQFIDTGNSSGSRATFTAIRRASSRHEVESLAARVRRLERNPSGLKISLRLLERGGPVAGAHAEPRRPMTVIDQNQRISGRLACRSS